MIKKTIKREKIQKPFVCSRLATFTKINFKKAAKIADKSKISRNFFSDSNIYLSLSTIHLYHCLEKMPPRGVPQYRKPGRVMYCTGLYYIRESRDEKNIIIIIIFLSCRWHSLHFIPPPANLYWLS